MAPVFVDEAKKAVWTIDNPDAVKGFYGNHVTVTATRIRARRACISRLLRTQSKGLEESMPRAIWNGKVIAESETTETVEGNVYFPEASLKREYFVPATPPRPVRGRARRGT